MSIPPVSNTPWNKGKLVGQKPPLKLKEIWAIRVRLQLSYRYRDLAMFNLAIDSKLRGSDLVKIKINDILNGGTVAKRAMIMQLKTGRPVQFEITENTREAISTWVEKLNKNKSEFLFPSRKTCSPHISTRQYARIVASCGLKRSGLIPLPMAHTRSTVQNPH